MDINTSNIKVIALQYAPFLKDIPATQRKVDSMLDKYTEKDNIDVLVLPELSFSGGTYISVEDILPYSEV